MVATTLLLLILTVTSWTDIRDGKIYNWSTYPAILLAIVLSSIVTLIGLESRLGFDDYSRWMGVVPLYDCLGGLLLCGGAMLVCYVFFAGQIGGGDIKLIAMMGAFLGIMEGLETMLWAFIIAGCAALIRLMWKIGPATLVSNTARYVWSVLRYRTVTRLTEQERAPLQTTLCLSPSAMAAVFIVRLELLQAWT